MSLIGQKQHMVAKMAAQKEGVAVTLTLASAGTEDPEAGTFTSPTSSTMTGYVHRIRGNPERYRDLKLIESESPTLDFTPDTYGDTPSLNASLPWGGVTHFVVAVDPWQPDGSTVSAQLVVSRG